MWVALHGFTLTGAQFSGLTAAAPCRILAPDLPGHGRTDVAPVTLDATLDALGEWIESLGGPVPVLGYSQGGRIALVLALARPELVDRLMLVSASPGIDSVAFPAVCSGTRTVPSCLIVRTRSGRALPGRFCSP